MNINVNIIGLDALERRFRQLGAEALIRSDRVTETYARKMANESAGMAPVKDNILAPSIAASPKRVKIAEWEYGSNVIYARRQEYEHATRKGFIRKAVWNNRAPYREALLREIMKR